MTSTRRRKQEKGDQQQQQDVVEPIDEVEQEKQIEQLRYEAQEQMELFHNIFSRVCEGAMFLSLVMGVTHQDTWCWIHVTGSIVLHWSATRIVASAATATLEGTRDGKNAAGYHLVLPLVALLVGVAVFVYEYYTNKENPTNVQKNHNTHHDNNLHHMALALANILTMVLALYLKRDCQHTKNQLVELEKSKYRYKTL